MKAMTTGTESARQRLHGECIEILFPFTVCSEKKRIAGSAIFVAEEQRDPIGVSLVTEEVTHENKSGTLRLLVTTELEVLASLER